MNDKHNKNIGKIGEETACKFLMKLGYRIIFRNYLRKWGEIDIIAKKDQVIYFIEVKTVSKDLSFFSNTESVSCESDKNFKKDVKHETLDDYRPEDNIHPWKLKRLSRVIQTYLSENNITDNYKWEFNAITVFLDARNKTAKVNHIKDIIL